jgi:hypothetical protein
MEEEVEKMRGRAHRNATIKIVVAGAVITFIIICIVMFIISKI